MDAGHAVPGYEHGFFLGASLFDHVQPRHAHLQGRDLRPGARRSCACPTSTRALQLVNAHEFGNGTAIFTSDGEAARKFCAVRAGGMVGVNVPIPVPMAFHSFGGWKRSLFGDLHVHGPDGVRFYTRLKTVTARWPTRHPRRLRVRHADDEIGMMASPSHPCVARLARWRCTSRRPAVEVPPRYWRTMPRIVCGSIPSIAKLFSVHTLSTLSER